jgi:nitrous oxidase accessory protein NosD
VIDNDLSSDDHAIVVMQSDHNLFEGNRPYSGVDRCFLMLESNENRIIGNRCNSEDGVTLGNSHRNLIAGNSLGGDRWPLSIRGDFNRIEGNFIASANDEPATVSLDGDYNQLTGNQVRGFDTNCSRDNDPIAGIHVLRGVGNRVAGNVVTEQCFDGILVESDARKTIVRQNVAAANGDDGIDVEDPTSLVVGNTALENGDYGIEAVPGARGGGNRALANGNPAQCLEIRCNVKGRPSPPGIAGAAQ